MKKIPENPTREKETEKKYILRANNLIKKAANDLKIKNAISVDMRQLVFWLESQKPKISRPTWRQYKSAIIYYLETLPPSEEIIEALDFLRDKGSDGCVLKSNKTSSLKLKKISIEDWEKIDKQLDKKTTKWSAHLKNWLKAGMLTGLRPIEWEKTVFFLYDDKIPALKVENAKATNGRANGVYRTLLLENLSVEELKTIKDHLQAVRTFSSINGYEFFYSGCAATLRAVCSKVWPRRKKHVTLYSTRHQFSADAKSSGFTRAEVAAMMGHAVDLTATIHYGKKINGQKPVSIKPIEEEVNTVKHIDKFDFKTFIKNAKAGNLNNINEDNNGNTGNNGSGSSISNI